MKVNNFATSVQHGSGYHYFLRTDYVTLAEAEVAQKVVTEQQKIAYEGRYRRGAKPTVHLWKLLKNDCSF